MRTIYLALIAVTFLLGCSSGSDPNPLELSDQEQFLVTNAAREGVIETESGLQYEVLREGDGAKPNANDVVTVEYIGTLTNGVEFDNSYTRDDTKTFMLSETIPGWVEGVQLMSVGSMYRFVIPPELAYGDRGAGTLIAPDAVLIFVVELLEVNSA